MKTILFAGLALTCLSLGACAGLPFTGNPAADAKTAASNLTAINGTLGTFNQKLMDQIVQSCGVDGQLNVAIPNPVPTGNLKIECHIAPGGLAKVAPGVSAGLPVGDTAVTLPAPAAQPVAH